MSLVVEFLADRAQQCFVSAASIHADPGKRFSEVTVAERALRVGHLGGKFDLAH